MDEPVRADVADGAIDGFAHCPRCREGGLVFEDGRRHRCGGCGWTFYRNAGAAVFAIVEIGGEVLLVRRAREPAAGTLDLPGGFVDPGETAEAALVREFREELDIEVRDLRFLGTYANEYPYAGVTYHTLDLCFAATVAERPDPARVDASELEEFVLIPRSSIDLAEVGMSSPRRALGDYLARAT